MIYGTTPISTITEVNDGSCASSRRVKNFDGSAIRRSPGSKAFVGVGLYQTCVHPRGPAQLLRKKRAANAAAQAARAVRDSTSTIRRACQTAPTTCRQSRPRSRRCPSVRRRTTGRACGTRQRVDRSLSLPLCAMTSPARCPREDVSMFGNNRRRLP